MYYECDQCGACLDLGERCECGGIAVRVKRHSGASGLHVSRARGAAAVKSPRPKREPGVPMPLELQRQTVKNLEEAYKRAAANGDFERYAELKQKYDILLPLILRDDDVAS